MTEKTNERLRGPRVERMQREGRKRETVRQREREMWLGNMKHLQQTNHHQKSRQNLL